MLRDNRDENEGSMRVEAIKVADGFLIPFAEGLQDLPHEKVVLEIELIEPAPTEQDYAALDQLVGFDESGDPTASTDHDRWIYRR